MRRLYLVLGMAVFGLGLVHIGSTPRFFDSLSSRALWFVSGGLALMMLGTLNLLNRSYGRDARGLAWTTATANLVMFGFAALSGYVGKASAGEMALMLGLLGATALLSVPRPLRRAHGGP